MDRTPVAAVRRSLPAAASRRDMLKTSVGGLLAAGPLARLSADSEARKRGKRRKKKRRNKRDKPKTRVDATCPAPNVTKLAPSSGDIRLAQTFTAQRSGQLVRADLALFGDGAAEPDFIVRLAAVDATGTPTNDVLAEAVIPGADVAAEGSTVSATFANPALLAAGSEYALVLARPGSGFFSWQNRGDNACAGRAFFSLNLSEAFQPANGQADHIFTTFARS